MKKRYSNKRAIGPRLFTYSDQYSVRGCAKNDLIISHSNDIVGKGGTRRSQIGDQVLVVAKKDDGYHLFTATIGNWVDDDRKDTWYLKGGNRWDTNYEISNKTDLAFLTKEEVQKITGASDEQMSRVFVGQFGTGNPLSKVAAVEKIRQKLFDHLSS